MFQIGGLIVFCGLLAQIMAQSETPDLPSVPAGPEVQNPAGLIGTLKNTLTNGLISQNLLGALQNIPLTNILKNQQGLGGILSGPLRFFQNAIDFKITDARLLQLGLVPSPDGHRLYATIPLGLDLSVNVPLVGSLLKAKVDLNITAQVLAVTNELGKIHLVVGDCTNSPGSLDVTVLNGKYPFIQNFADGVTTALTRVFPELVRRQVCFVLNGILSQLDVTMANNIANGLFQGLNVGITI